MSDSQNHNQIRSCLNCGAEISLANKHCQKCGQKTKSPKLTVWLVVKDFFVRVFDLDSKFFKTFLHVWIPGKLTKAYIAGKRERYYNPIRILFIAMIVHFALLGIMITKDASDSFSFIEEDKKITHQMEFLSKIDSLTPIYMDRKSTENLDSLLADLSKTTFKNTDTIFLRNFNLGRLSWDSLQIKKSDVYDMEAHDVADKYGIKDWLERAVFIQIVKIAKNPEALPAFLIGNSIWTVLIVLLFIALIMKLLYIRKFYYYAEHLVLLIHIHSTCFIMATIVFLISFLNGENLAMIDKGLSLDTPASFIAFLLSAIFMFVSLKIYYKQGFIKTGFKFLLICSAYSVILLIAAFAVSLLSLVFF